MAAKLIGIEDLNIHYEADGQIVHAVNGLSIDLDRGENLGLVGESGAGKTTTALGIMRLLPKASGRIVGGRIELEGLDLLGLREEEMRDIRGSRISMIFQDPMTSLNPVMSVGDQVAEVLRYHDRDKGASAGIGDRVDELLGLVGISPKRKREFPHQFSGGMKQRIVIAIALACEPELLLADEPTTALDVTIQAQVLDLMEELRRKLDTSMILITHDLGVVAEMCDKVAIMYAGQIIEQGTARDIFEGAEHHPYTQGLFLSIPDLDKGSRRLSPIGGLMPDPTRLPEGCKFHPRCPKRMDACRIVEPSLGSASGHGIKCHLFASPDGR
jgi:peptide/nickel transport system ATP-binding protein